MTSEKLKLGILLPTRGLLLDNDRPTSIQPVLDMAKEVESAGLDSVWVGDSLTAKPRLEPLSTLSAIAAQTNTVRLGTAVMLMGLRHPLLLAQTMATVDLVSQGRLIIATGIGGAFNDAQKKEWESVSVISSRRAGRLEEMLYLIKSLNRGENITYHGRHFDIDDTVMLPVAVRDSGVPILLACHGRSKVRDIQIQRAAKLGDGIISISDTPEEYAEMVKDFYQSVSELGRDLCEVQTTMYMTINMDENVGRAKADAEEWLLGYYGANIWGNRWGPFGDPQRVLDRIVQYKDAGAETIIVRFASFDQDGQLNDFLSKIAPALL